MKTKYHYTALNAKGGETSGTIEATSEIEAINSLRGEGLYPTRVVPEDTEARAVEATKAKAGVWLSRESMSRGGFNSHIRRVHRFSLRGIVAWLCSPLTRRHDVVRDRRVLWSALGTLTQSGVPILMSLKVCAQGAAFPENRNLMLAVHDFVAEGDSVTRAFESRKISPIEVALISVGEQMGQLPEALRMIGDLPDERRLRGDIQLGLVSLLALLLEAKLTLVQALNLVEQSYRESGEAALSKVAKDLARQVEGGSTFAEALQRHPEFDPIALCLVRAGELGGALEVTLARLRDWMLDDYRRLGYMA